MVVEMSAKKRWFSKIYSDSQESRTDTDISWSSSDSDDQESPKGPPVKRRMKVTELLQRTKSKSWINVDVTPPKNMMPLQQDVFFDSPTFSEVKLEEQSPVLTQPNLCPLKEQSPVISRNKIVRKIKWCCRHKKEKIKAEVIQDETSDSSLSQSRLVIDSQSSPSKTQVTISPAKSELSQPNNIDPFPSQHSSEVVSDSFTSSASDPKLLWYYPPPRKKRFRKGSLANQLQKAVHLQNTSAAIWQHEVFLSEIKGEGIHQSDVNAGKEFEFFVMNIWKEYGCSILECKCGTDTNTKEVLSSFGHSDIENYNTFMLVTDLINPTNVIFQSNNSYKIFPPYSTKVVRHESENTVCIINASRFLSV